MKNFIFKLIGLVAIISACNTNPRASIPNTGNFGGTVGTDSVKTVAVVTNLALLNANTYVNVSGKIEKYCKGEGCWLTLQNPNGGEALFIEVENKSFVLPLNIENKMATVSGKISIDSAQSEGKIKIVASAISIQ
jgi:hypothetical protein